MGHTSLIMACLLVTVAVAVAVPTQAPAQVTPSGTTARAQIRALNNAVLGQIRRGLNARLPRTQDEMLARSPDFRARGLVTILAEPVGEARVIGHYADGMPVDGVGRVPGTPWYRVSYKRTIGYVHEHGLIR